MSSGTGVAREERDSLSNYSGVLTIGESTRFTRVMTRGRSAHWDGFSLKFVKDDSIGENLYGFVLRRKFAKAHLRNRYRRLAKEYLRLNRSRIRQGCLVVIAFHRGNPAVTYSEVAQGLEGLFRSAGLLLNKGPLVGPDGWTQCLPGS